MDHRDVGGGERRCCTPGMCIRREAVEVLSGRGGAKAGVPWLHESDACSAPEPSQILRQEAPGPEGRVPK